MLKRDLIGEAKMKKAVLMNDKDTDEWIELFYGPKNKSAGKLRIRYQHRGKTAVDKFATALDHKMHIMD